MDPRQTIIQVMRAQGFRLTPQRQVIMDAVLASEGHSTLLEIYQRARTMAPNLNLVTVYRTLNFFCELRLMVAADIGGGRWVFELAGGKPHHHLVCRTCGQIKRIEHAEMQGLVERTELEHEFRIDMEHIVLFGLCKDCKK